MANMPFEEGIVRPSELVKKADYVPPVVAGKLRIFERKVWHPIQLLRNRVGERDNYIEFVDQYEGECLEDEVRVVHMLREHSIPRRVAKDVLRTAAAEHPFNRFPFGDRVSTVEMIILRLERVGETIPQ